MDWQAGGETHTLNAAKIEGALRLLCDASYVKVEDETNRQHYVNGTAWAAIYDIAKMGRHPNPTSLANELAEEWKIYD